MIGKSKCNLPSCICSRIRDSIVSFPRNPSTPVVLSTGGFTRVAVDQDFFLHYNTERLTFTLCAEETLDTYTIYTIVTCSLTAIAVTFIIIVHLQYCYHTGSQDQT